MVTPTWTYTRHEDFIRALINLRKVGSRSLNGFEGIQRFSVCDKGCRGHLVSSCFLLAYLGENLNKICLLEKGNITVGFKRTAFFLKYTNLW